MNDNAVLVAGEWSEEDHPRDEDGKFTSSGGGASGSARSETVVSRPSSGFGGTVGKLWTKFLGTISDDDDLDLDGESLFEAALSGKAPGAMSPDQRRAFVKARREKLFDSMGARFKKWVGETFDSGSLNHDLFTAIEAHVDQVLRDES